MDRMHGPQVVCQNSITYTLPFSMPLTGSPLTQVSTLNVGTGLPMVSGSAATTPADPRARRTANAKLMRLIELPPRARRPIVWRDDRRTRWRHHACAQCVPPNGRVHTEICLSLGPGFLSA